MKINKTGQSNTTSKRDYKKPDDSVFANLTDRFTSSVKEKRGGISKSDAAKLLLRRRSKHSVDELWSRKGYGNFLGSGITDDKGIYYGANYKTAMAIDPETGKSKWEYEHSEKLTGWMMMDDKKNFYVSDEYGKILMFDCETGENKHILKLENKKIRPVKGPNGAPFATDGATFYSIDTDKGTLKKEYSTIKEGEKYFGSYDGESPPVLGDDGYIYTSLDRGAMAKIDGKNGEILWEVPTEGLTRSPVGIGPGGNVYAGNTDCHFHCVDSKTGKKKWTLKADNYFLITPAFCKDGTVIMGSSDHNVYALDPETGKMKWKTDVKSEVRVTPTVGKDGVIAVASDRNVLFGLDEKTGIILWEQKASSYMHSPPTFGKDGTVFIKTNDSKLHAYKDTQLEMEIDVLRNLDKSKSDNPDLKVIRDDKTVNIGGVVLDVRNDG